MNEWKKVKIDFDTIKLRDFIESVKIKVSDIDALDLIIYGVTNKDGICETGKTTSEDISNYIVLEENCFVFNPYRINVGSIGINDKNLKGCVSPAYVVFKTKNGLLPEFLFYYMKSDYGNHLINFYGNRGGVRNALRYSDLCNIDIPDITKINQYVVVDKLNNLFEKLKNLTTENEKQREYIKKLRQSILQDAIDTGRSAKLGNICNLIKGETSIQKSIPGSYPLVCTSDEPKTCNNFQFDCEAVCVPLVSSSGHGKKSIKNIHYQTGKFALGNILCAIIPKDLNQIGVRYLHTYLLMNKDTVLVPLMKGMANVSLSIKDISEINIPLLPFNSNPRIVSITETKLKKIEELEQEIKQREIYINSLKQSVMREVFEGEK